MKKTVLRFTLSLCALLCTSFPAESFLRPVPPKFLQYGWELTDNQELAAKHREMEAAMPFFDGVLLKMNGRNTKGQPITTLGIWNPIGEWGDDCFAQAVEELKSCQFERFHDNFVMTWASPGPVDWLDESGWRNICRKFRLVASAAKAAGLKGVCLDPEPYQKFNWEYHASCGHSFDELWEVARRRGREVMTALAEGYPDMTFLCFWMFSLPQAQGEREALPGGFWALYPAFLNGLWDAVPPQMTLVDGSESGYSVSSELQAMTQAAAIRRGGFSVQDSSHADRYRRQLQMGWGIYLDPYLPKTKAWIVHDGTELQALRRNVGYLLRTPARYLWVYGERGRWRPSPNPKASRPWEEQLPGITNTFLFLKDPLAARHSQSPNLVRNSELSPTYIHSPESDDPPDWRPSKEVPGFSLWFSGAPLPIRIIPAAEGNLCCVERPSDTGSRRCAVSAQVAVPESNATFLFEMEIKTEGECSVEATANFFRAKGGWLSSFPMVRVPGSEKDGFVTYRVVATAPDTAARTALMFYLYAKKGGKGCFRKPGIFLLTPAE